MDYKSACLAEMDRKEIKYTDPGGNRVKVVYAGKNTNNVEVSVFFDEEGEGLVGFKCWSFGKVPSDRRGKVLEACNKLNNNYRWVKFYIDNDEDLTVSMDAVVDPSSVGAECVQLVSRIADIYDDAFQTLATACYG